MTKALSWTAALIMMVPTSRPLLAGPAEYRMQLLPVPAGCESGSVFHGLDQPGVAVGFLVCPPSPAHQAVVWAGSSLTALATLGGPDAFAYGIGHSGRIVGTAETPEMYESGFHVTRPVVWEDGEVRDLGTLGGPIGAATAIAPSGMIVGVCEPEAVEPSLGRRPDRACVWEKGSARDLGDLGGPEAAALDVNARGWTVGFAMTATPYPTGDCCEEHAFLHDGQTMRDLGTVGGLASVAYSINVRGEVVGFSIPASDTGGGLPTLHAFVWREGLMRDLGTLGGAFAEAMDINDQGDIVGWSFAAAPLENWPDRAVLWHRDEAFDLNDLVPDRAGCVLTSATAIDNAGAILANARCDYKQRVVLLTPVRASR